MAIKILKSIPRGDSEYLVPNASTRKDKGRIPWRRMLKAAGSAVEAPATVYSWRHTVETRLSKMDIKKQVQDAILDHKDGSMTARYDRNDHLPEMRAALEKWAAEVARITGPGLKVVKKAS